MGYRHLYLIGFGLSCGSIAFFEMKNCHRLPWPPRFIYTAIFFVMLDLFSGFNEEIAGVMAIGTVIAIIMKEGFTACEPLNTTGQVAPTTAAFIGGSTGPQVAATQQPSSEDLFQ